MFKLGLGEGQAIAGFRQPTEARSVIWCLEMSDATQELEPKKEAAIIALLSSRSIEDAAQVAGVDSRTIYRWLKEPAFDAEYRTARRTAYGQALARLHQMATAAVSTIAKIMVDQGSPASVRLRAADSVLAHVQKGIELQDIEARLAEVERAAEASKKMKQSLVHRLERVESALAPPKKNVLVFRVTSPGLPDWTVELPVGEPTRGKRGDRGKSR